MSRGEKTFYQQQRKTLCNFDMQVNSYRRKTNDDRAMGKGKNFSNTQQHRVLWFTMCYCIEWSIAIGARNPGNDVFCVIVHWADRMALHGHWTHHKTITCLNVKSKQTGEIKIKLALRVCAAQCHECDHLHQSTNRNIDREKKKYTDQEKAMQSKTTGKCSWSGNVRWIAFTLALNC